MQAQLGFSKKFDFKGIDFTLNQRWTNTGDPLLSSTKDLTYILDKNDVRILVMHGNNDVSVNTPGNIRAFGALLWKGQGEYKQTVFRPWSFTDAKRATKQGGLTKGEGRLVFVSVDDAGHDVPASQPEAVLKVLGQWMKVEKMS